MFGSSFQGPETWHQCKTVAIEIQATSKTLNTNLAESLCLEGLAGPQHQAWAILVTIK